MVGFYITMEGTEGCGKSTQKELLCKRLLADGYDVVPTKQPGGTDVGAQIRQVLISSENKNKILPITESLLFWADRYQHYETVVKPSVVAGKIVVGDRDFDSSWAYQCFGRKIPEDWMHKIQKLVIDDFKPNLTLLYDGPVNVFLERVKQRKIQNGILAEEARFDDETVDFHNNVRCGFLALARTNSERFLVLDGTQGQDILHQTTYELVKERMKKSAD